MSEYTNIENPFLQKLRETGWKVIDKGDREHSSCYGAKSQSRVRGEI